jgi:PrtD family type I secretion system ABC transporter
MEHSRNTPLRSALAAARGALVPVGLFSMVFNILALGVPIYTMQVYDRMFGGGSWPTLIYLSLAATGVLVVSAMLDVARSMVAVRVSRWLEDCLAPQAFAHAIQMALHSREYTTEALHDLSTVRTFLGGAVLFMLFDALWAPVYLAIIFLLHPWLGAVSVVSALILVVLAGLNERMTRPPLHAANSHRLRTMRTAEMMMRNADAVVGMGMTGSVTDRWAGDNNRVLDLHVLASRRSTALIATTKSVRLLIQIGILAVGAILVIDQKISGGALIAASIILSRALAPIEQAIGMWRQIVDYRTAHDRLTRFFAKPGLPQRGMALPAPQGQLRVADLTFTPPGAQAPVLSSVSFAAEPGETIAVVGPSAAGKTTLARLLVATWQPTSGVVRLDGADIHAWPREDLGQYIGYVPQDVELFAGTVRDNIARMATGDGEAVVRAAQMAGVHDMIVRLPNGYDTDIGEAGARLSGGQRQRVALARVVYGGPRLVVLDEPNANLDSDGELALARTVVALKDSGATTFVISHRQSILMQADKILVLRNGTVDMFGPRHDVLRELRAPVRTEASAPPALAETADRRAVS